MNTLNKKYRYNAMYINAICSIDTVRDVVQEQHQLELFKGKPGS